MRLRIPDPVLLLAFCGFFFLWRLSAFGLIGADEPRYAQVAREMLARHDWITPTLGGVPWLEKPPLYYWQAILSFQIFGVSDWGARLPGVLDATALVIAVYLFLRRFRSDCALDGALMLATSAAIVGFARAASTDMPLAATFGIAMLAWFAWFETGKRLLIVGFYVATALGMLAKGPVAPVLAFVVILLFAASQRSWSVLLKSLSLPGVVGFFVVALPWYVLVQLRNPQFLRIFFLEHNLARFGTNMFHHPEPFWYYIPVTLLGWVPWAGFVCVALTFVVQSFRKRNAEPLNAFLLIWIAVFLVFFSISRSKLPGYILPASAPGILLLAAFLHGKKATKLHPAVPVLHAMLMGTLVFAVLMLPSILHEHKLVWNQTAAIPAVIAVVAGLLVWLVLLRTGFSGLHLGSIAPAIVVLALAVRFSSAYLDQALSARPVSEQLSRLSHQVMPVAVVQVPRELEFGLEFYRNQTIPRYELGQIPAGEHLVVMQMGFRGFVEKSVAGRRLIYLGDFPAQNLKFFYVEK